jgi:hypothetical protein
LITIWLEKKFYGNINSQLQHKNNKKTPIILCTSCVLKAIQTKNKKIKKKGLLSSATFQVIFQAVQFICCDLQIIYDYDQSFCYLCVGAENLCLNRIVFQVMYGNQIKILSNGYLANHCLCFWTTNFIHLLTVHWISSCPVDNFIQWITLSSILNNRAQLFNIYSGFFSQSCNFVNFWQICKFYKSYPLDKVVHWTTTYPVDS